MIQSQQIASTVATWVQDAAGLLTLSASYVKCVNQVKARARFVSQVQNSVM